MTEVEVGKVYKVNNASKWKILSVDETSVIAFPWPTRSRDHAEILTYGAKSNNIFVEVKTHGNQH